jgi:hypothetical protein
MRNENTHEDNENSDYTSVQDSESTERVQKFSNINKTGPNIEESGVSSSLPISDGRLGSSAKKQKKGSMVSVSESGPLKDTSSEADSESMSMSVSANKKMSAYQDLIRKYTSKQDDSDDDDSDDDDDDISDS